MSATPRQTPPGDRPLTLGIFAGDIETAFALRLVAGIVDQARELGARTVFLPGHPPAAPTEYERQFNLLFRMPDEATFDGLLVIGTTLQYFLSPAQLDAFFETMPAVPTLSLGFASKAVPSVVIDNYGGFRGMVEHLIAAHGCRRIAMIAGPAGHAEADERLAAWRDACADAGVAPDPALVVHGDFGPPSGRRAMEQLLASGVSFDAVVAANDGMALEAMSYSVDQGLHVPDQVRFAGFDDILASGRLGVGLTTVNQPLYELGRVSVARLADLVAGRSVTPVTRVPTRLVRRQSCGCARALALPAPDGGLPANRHAGLLEELSVAPERAPQYADAILAVERGLEQALAENDFQPFLAVVHDVAREALKAEGHVFGVQALLVAAQRWLIEPRALAPGRWAAVCRWLQQAQIALAALQDFAAQDRQRIRSDQALAFRELLKSRIATFDVQKLLDSLSDALADLRLDTCCIALYSGTAHIHSLDDYEVPEVSRLLYAHVGGREQPRLHGQQFRTRELLPAQALAMLPADGSFVVYPLFLGKEHFGLIVFNVDPMAGGPWEAIRDEVSSTLKASLLVSELAAARDALRDDLDRAREGERHLADIAHRDELTGLLNRRGFLSEAEPRVQRMQADGHAFAVFFADLDGLKPINDHHGHAAGDKAIRQAADVLRHGFRAGDLIARLGGDEFVVLAANADPAMLQTVRERIYGLFERASETLPFRLACSLGHVVVPPGTDISLDEMLARADSVLYEEKRHRKGAAIVLDS